MSRRAIPATVIAAIVLGAMVGLLFTGIEVQGILCVEAFLLGVFLVSGRRPLATALGWRAVLKSPWRPYFARITGSESTLYVDLYAANTPKNGRSDFSFRPWATKKQREELKSGAYGNVWFVGRESSHGLVVPSGGGLAVFVRRRTVIVPRSQRTPASAAPLTPRQLARQQRQAEKAAARTAGAAARSKQRQKKAREKAARMTPEQKARTQRKLEQSRQRKKLAQQRATVSRNALRQAAQNRMARAAQRRQTGLFGRRRQSLGQFLPKDRDRN
jgi:flagellar biosynthesis GTPase FlhF